MDGNGKFFEQEPWVTVEPCNPTAPAAALTVIFLHGFGSNARTFEPRLQSLMHALPEARFVLPSAPLRPVSVAAGYPLRAWFDMSFNNGAVRRALLHARHTNGRSDVMQSVSEATQLPLWREDQTSLNHWALRVHALVVREARRYAQPRRVVLGGYSQGGAMVIHYALQHRSQIADLLAGVVVLSGFDPGPRPRRPCNGLATHQGRGLPPLLQLHGAADNIVPLARANADYRNVRDRQGWTDSQFLVLPTLGHSICENEQRLIANFIRRHCRSY